MQLPDFVRVLSLTVVPIVAWGQDERPVRVRINTWIGCLPGLVANGGLDTTRESIYGKSGIRVKFEVTEDWAVAAAAMASGGMDVMLTTADVWAKDYMVFRDVGFRAQAFFMVDFSRGADGMIVRPGINVLKDLIGKRIAFAPYTPSHFLLWKALQLAGLSKAQENAILANEVLTHNGVEPAILFGQGKVDAAITWEPEMTIAVNERKGGGRVLFDSKSGDHIADVLVVSGSFAERHAVTLQKLIRGWLDAVAIVRDRPDYAYAIASGSKLFPEIRSPADLTGMLKNVLLADCSENKNFFRRASTTTTGAQGEVGSYYIIMKDAQDFYKQLRVLSDREPQLEKTVDTSFLDIAARSCAIIPQPGPKASCIATETDTLLHTETLHIKFASGSTRIDDQGMADIRKFAENHRSWTGTYLKIEGNTDSVGPLTVNKFLSTRRAYAVRDFLRQNYSYVVERFCTAGNGPSNPVGDNGTEEGRRENRRTDIKVYIPRN